MNRDTRTLDLFRDAEPTPVVARFTADLVRAANPRARLARAVTAALKAFDAEREQIAGEMSNYLGESVTKHMLDQYASQANEQHAIPAHRLVALAVVTGDARLINALLEDTGLVAVPEKYEPLIERELTKEQIARLQRRLGAHSAEWEAKR